MLHCFACHPGVGTVLICSNFSLCTGQPSTGAKFALVHQVSSSRQATSFTDDHRRCTVKKSCSSGEGCPLLPSLMIPQKICLDIALGTSRRDDKRVSWNVIIYVIAVDVHPVEGGNFAQWRYSNQWSNREVLLLLVENYTQYPAQLRWNTLGWGNFYGLP